MKSSVKNYTDRQLISQMRSLKSFQNIPNDIHIIAVRSNEDTPDKYDDKLYLFRGEICIGVTSCTTNSGLYGLRNFFKWNSKGTAVIKSDEVYYNAFQKSDGIRVRHHNLQPLVMFLLLICRFLTQAESGIRLCACPDP